LDSKRFWIDQISINQQDDKEKGHQVNLMPKIYANAAQVVSYLGPRPLEDRYEDRAIEMIATLDAHFKPNYDYLDEYEPEYLWYKGLPIQTLPQDIDKKDGAWPQLLRIVYGGWLRRLWMVQVTNEAQFKHEYSEDCMSFHYWGIFALYMQLAVEHPADK